MGNKKSEEYINSQLEKRRKRIEGLKQDSNDDDF